MMRPWLAETAEFTGAIHRPFGFVVVVVSFAIALLAGAGEGPLTISAGLVTAMYLGRTWENNTAAKATADVKKTEVAGVAAAVQLKAAVKQDQAADKQLDAAGAQ